MINAVLITAAGHSHRFGEKKEYMPFGDGEYSTVISQCVYTFLQTELFGYVTVTVPKGDTEKVQTLIENDMRIQEYLKTQGVQLSVIEGGSTRQKSVYAGLLHLETVMNAQSLVFVHDGARPWVSPLLVQVVYATAEKYGAAIPVTPVTDTQKEVDETCVVTRHLHRDRIVAAQTPQAFIFQNILSAHKIAENDGRVYTDDSEIYAAYCSPVYTCAGMRENKKITFRDDMGSTP